MRFKWQIIISEVSAALLILFHFAQIFLWKNVPPPLALTILALVVITFLMAIILFLGKEEAEGRRRLKEFSEELKKKNEILENLDKAKSEFISITSHQLRTPLSLIKGYLSLALEGIFGQLSVGLQEKLSRVYRINERLIRLVNDLLDVSKIEQGRMEYKFTEMDIIALLQRVSDEFGWVIKEHDLKYEAQLPEEPITIYGDEEKLYHVFASIMDNASHYTLSGSVMLSAKVAEDRRTIRIAVKDTGIGLEPEDMNRLYTKFVRGHLGSRTFPEGAGLGLFVAKNIVEEHRGKIWAESEGRGRGSTFFIELPILQK